MIRLDYRDSRPIYEQVAERFTQLILKGVLPPHEKLPSVRQLAVELSINPNTIQRSYQILEQNGMIYSQKGRGSFVAENFDLMRREKKKLILNQVEKAAREALMLEIPKSELIRRISLIYQGGENV